jgi:hypothetical protein
MGHGQALADIILHSCFSDHSAVMDAQSVNLLQIFSWLETVHLSRFASGLRGPVALTYAKNEKCKI